MPRTNSNRKIQLIITKLSQSILCLIKTNIIHSLDVRTCQTCCKGYVCITTAIVYVATMSNNQCVVVSFAVCAFDTLIQCETHAMFIFREHDHGKIATNKIAMDLKFSNDIRQRAMFGKIHLN